MRKFLLQILFFALAFNFSQIINAQNAQSKTSKHAHLHQKELLIRQTLKHIETSEYKLYVRNKLFKGLSDNEIQEALIFLKPYLINEKKIARRKIWEQNMSVDQLYQYTDQKILELTAILNNYNTTGDKGEQYDYLSDLFLNQRNNPKPDQVMAACTNAGFESGNTNGWVCATGTNAGSANSGTPYDFSLTNNNDCSLSQVVSTGNDPVIPGLTRVPPGGGNFACLLNHVPPPNGSASRISQTFTVSPSTTSFTVKYAVVLEDPGTSHTVEEKPFFTIRVLKPDGTTFSCADYSVIVGQGTSNFQSYNSGGLTYYWLNWQTVVVPLANFVGQNVTLEVTVADCSQTGHSGWAYIDASCEPLGILSSSPAICGGDFITLTAPSGGTSYNWSGPNGYSSNTNPISVNVPGNYTVTIVPQAGSSCSYTIDTLIAGNPGRPTANFTSSVICAGNPTQFTDASTPVGGITQWGWDFNNDGVNDNTTQSPSYTFPAAGTYPVKLSITWPPCVADTTLNVVVSPLPKAVFSANTVCLGNPTVFNSSSSVLNGGTNPTYSWNFGEPSSGANNTSSQSNPTHAYLTGGTFTVYMSVTVNGVCSSDTTMQITVNAAPIANFTANSPCFNQVTNFTDSSTPGSGTNTQWVWIFSDPNNTNNTSNSQNPTHVYTAPGTFNVTLVVTNSNNCSNDTTMPVTVHPLPVADFTFSDACLNAPNTLNGSPSSVSSGTISTYQWDVNSSIASFEYNGQTTNHTPGVVGAYNVSLVTTTALGCKDTVTKSVNVWPMPVADFSFDIVCANSPTSFVSASTVATPDNISAFSWDFDNNGTSDASGINSSNSFTVGGTKTVELLVITNHGCKDSVSKSVYVNYIPTPDFTFNNACFYDALTFNNTSTITGPAIINTYSWNFGDNSTDATSAPTHNYSVCNTYTVSLTVTSDSGCTSTISKTVQAYCKPNASFSASDICEYQVASFNGTTSSVSDGTIATYNWDFNLTGTFNIDASGAQPTHNYTYGDYLVGLIVISNFGCRDTVSDSISVHQQPTANFTPDAVCFGSASSFQDTSLISAPGETVVTWAWDFLNNGSIDNTQQNPQFVFPVEGSIPVKLIVSTNFNCYDTLVKNIMVNPIPKTNFTAPNVCFNNSTAFSNTSTINSIGQIASYSWTFGDGNNSTQLSPSHLYAAENKYNVCLYTSSDKNCRDSICKDVIVFPLPKANFLGDPLRGCEPLPVTFTNLSSVTSINNPTANDQIATYSWVYGDGSTNITSSGSPVVNIYKAGTYSVSLFVVTNNGCTDDTTLFSYVQAYPLPVADFNFGPQPTTVLKPTILFSDLSSGADTVYWDFGDSTSTIVINEIGEGFLHEYADSGKYIVTQIVQTEYGCLDTIRKTVYIGPDWTLYVPNAFTPNGDNFNDYFMPKGIGIIEFEMRIYDRWGNYIARIEDINNKGWDGKVENYDDDCQQDVYVYRINFRDIFSKRRQLTGTFTLVR